MIFILVLYSRCARQRVGDLVFLLGYVRREGDPITCRRETVADGQTRLSTQLLPHEGRCTGVRHAYQATAGAPKAHSGK